MLSEMIIEGPMKYDFTVTVKLGENPLGKSLIVLLYNNSVVIAQNPNKEELKQQMNELKCKCPVWVQ